MSVIPFPASAARASVADFAVAHHGTVCLLRPLTPAATINGAAMSAGNAAGSRVDLGGHKVGGTGQRMLGR